MPSHTSVAAIGTQWKSNGKRVTAIEWRANQLADALAKQGAPDYQTNANIDKLFVNACGATQQAAALLAAVTYAANNHKVTKVKADGTSYVATCRDCTGPPARQGDKAKGPKPPRVQPMVRSDEILVSSGSEAGTPRGVQRRRSAKLAAETGKKADAAATHYVLASAAAGLKRKAEVPADQRLAALKQRVIDKENANLPTPTVTRVVAEATATQPAPGSDGGGATSSEWRFFS